MKLTIPSLTAAASLLLAAPLFAQSSGVSHPEDLNDSISATTQAPPQHYQKPSAGIPIDNASAPAPVLHDRSYVPPASGSDQPSVETAQIVRREAPLTVTDDINSGVVIDVPTNANELPEGTLFRTVLDSEISTQTTARGAAFHTQLTQNIEHRGRVIIPAGSILSGRVSNLHEGRRISGSAAIHLQPEFVTLPDGVTYRLDAQVVDLAHIRNSHVSGEGTIVGNDHSKGTLTTLGLTTGAAAVTGAVVGGGVGAVVGAGIGAGVGTVWWLKHENQETLHAGTEIIFSLTQPMPLEPANR
jgi:hypothetical protein